MRTKTLFVLAALLLLTTPLMASTSSSGAAAKSEFPSSSEVTKTVTMVIKGVDADNTLRVFDVRTEEELVIQVADSVKVRAQDKKAFDGRKKLAFADLAEGQRIKLTFRSDDGQILTIKVLKKA